MVKFLLLNIFLNLNKDHSFIHHFSIKTVRYFEKCVN